MIQVNPHIRFNNYASKSGYLSPLFSFYHFGQEAFVKFVILEIQYNLDKLIILIN
jgi:hypothetical protein